MVKELKRELSKLSGVNFFNPKFRDVFQKYFPDDASNAEDSGLEEERLKQVIGEDSVEALLQTGKEETPAPEETPEEDGKGACEPETEEDEAEAEPEAEEEEPDEESPEAQAEEVAADEDFGEEATRDVSEEPAEGLTRAQAETKAQDAASGGTPDTIGRELLETKLELELIKAQVREDRLEAAKRLLLPEIRGIEDLARVRALIGEYPEWIRKDRAEAQPFGIPVDAVGDGLTAEERRLKEMGIDPK